MVPTLKAIIKKYFNGNIHDFMKVLPKPIETNKPNLKNIFSLLPSGINKSSLFFYLRLDPMKKIDGGDAIGMRDNYEKRIDKKDSNKFNGTDKKVFTRTQGELQGIINKLKADNTVGEKRFVAQFKREKKNDKFEQLELTFHGWIGGYSGKFLPSTPVSVINFYDESTKYINTGNASGKNPGICHVLNPNPADKSLDYIDNWLASIPFPNGVKMHMGYSNSINNVIFSNVDTLKSDEKIIELIKSFDTNISSSDLLKYKKIILFFFDDSYFDQGQACCPPAE